MDEAEAAEATEKSGGSAGELSLLEFAEGSALSPEKNELVEIASLQVRRVYRHQGVAITDDEVKKVARLQV